MASSSAKNSPLLPMTTAPAADSPPPRTEEKLFKGSAMTKRGAYAAISYMSCAGMNISSFFVPSILAYLLLLNWEVAFLKFCFVF